MNGAAELPSKWVNWPQALAWVQHGDPEVLLAITDAMGERPLDDLCTSAARIASMSVGDERRETAAEYPTSDEAEQWLLEGLRQGRVSAQGRPAPGAALKDIPASEWQSPHLHWSATVDLGPAAYPGSVLYYDIRVASDALEVLKVRTGEAPERAVVMSTGLALRECGDWLREQFRAAETAAWAKPAFRQAALEKFAGRLSGRGFDQVWSGAVKEYPNRAKAGAKPKS